MNINKLLFLPICKSCGRCVDNEERTMSAINEKISNGEYWCSQCSEALESVEVEVEKVEYNYGYVDARIVWREDTPGSFRFNLGAIRCVVFKHSDKFVWRVYCNDHEVLGGSNDTLEDAQTYAIDELFGDVHYTDAEVLVL